jgi:hypothetical protein
MVAAFLPEWWPLSCRNRGRIRPEYAVELLVMMNLQHS